MIFAYAAVGGFAAGLAMGAFIATGMVAPRKYDEGFAAGIEAQKLKSAQEMDNVRSELRAQYNEELRKAEARENERQRIQQAAVETGRVEHAQNSAAIAAHELRLLGILRDPGAAGDQVRSPDRSPRVPQASCAPRRAAATPATGQLSDGDRADLVRLAARAEQLSAQYALCLKALPGVTP